MDVLGIYYSLMRLCLVLVHSVRIPPRILGTSVVTIMVLDVVANFALFFEHFAKALLADHTEVFGGVCPNEVFCKKNDIFYLSVTLS